MSNLRWTKKDIGPYLCLCKCVPVKAAEAVMSRVQVSWHGTYGYHSLGPWDQCAHHWQWSLYRSPPDAPAQACAVLLCVANTVTMCPPLQMEMLRNNHHITRDTGHVTGAQCRVWPVSPSPHWPRSRPHGVVTQAVSHYDGTTSGGDTDTRSGLRKMFYRRFYAVIISLLRSSPPPVTHKRTNPVNKT